MGGGSREGDLVPDLPSRPRRAMVAAAGTGGGLRRRGEAVPAGMDRSGTKEAGSGVEGGRRRSGMRDPAGWIWQQWPHLREREREVSAGRRRKREERGTAELWPQVEVAGGSTPVAGRRRRSARRRGALAGGGIRAGERACSGAPRQGDSGPGLPWALRAAAKWGAGEDTRRSGSGCRGSAADVAAAAGGFGGDKWRRGAGWALKAR